MKFNENLTDRIELALQNSPHLGYSKIEICQQADQIILKGRVDSYFEKQIAQETLRCVEGVNQIVNKLEVCWT